MGKLSKQGDLHLKSNTLGKIGCDKHSAGLFRFRFQADFGSTPPPPVEFWEYLPNLAKKCDYIYCLAFITPENDHTTSIFKF